MVDWQGRSLIDLASFTAAEIEAILTQALAMKKFIASGAKKTDLLRGKAIVNVFSENSTRTRSSFELAGKYLGADVININKST
ncbi:MAG: aspartate carbamoyltransferase, partial [Negativicoccus succinicivorans]|nr:aspartate carbamoyltransferase [Negativicoccus succinicivorans]